MKRKNLWHLLAVVMVAMLSVGFTSCGSDDDDEPTLKITKDMLVGSWEVTNVTANSGDELRKVYVGATMKFYSDGTCACSDYMENAYRISNGRLETYYKETGEPMFVYTLLAQKGDVIKLMRNGTLDDHSVCMLTLEKYDEIASLY